MLDLAFARRHARPLVGPAAASLIADPPAADVERAFDAMVDWYERNEPAHAATARRRADHWRETGTFVAKPGLPSDRTPP